MSVITGTTLYIDEPHVNFVKGYSLSQNVVIPFDIWTSYITVSC